MDFRHFYLLDFEEKMEPRRIEMLFCTSLYVEKMKCQRIDLKF